MANTSLRRAAEQLRARWRDPLRVDIKLPVWLAALEVATLLALSWFTSYALGGAGRIAPHWFYIPILVAAGRFGVPGVWITGIAAGLLAGPLTPLDVDAGTRQATSDWVSRAIFFVGIGTIMSWIIRRLKEAMERDLAVRRHEIELARRTEAVVQSVGHEFRTPLTVIHGTVELLLGGRVRPEQYERFLEGIANSAERLDALVDTVTATSEALNGDIGPQEFAVDQLCDQISGELTDLQGPDRVTVEAPVTIAGGRKFLAIALRAVIGNALKFSPQEATVNVNAAQLGDTVVLVVRDRGPGIDEQVASSSLKTPFHPDRRTAAAGGGLGLGLYAASRALDRIGGTISFETAPAGGTRAILRIPAEVRLRGNTDHPQSPEPMAHDHPYAETSSR